MHALSRTVTILLVGLLVCATSLTAQQPQQKTTAGKKRPATQVEYTQLAHYSEVQAKIVSTDPTSREATIEIDVPHLQRNATMRSSSSRSRRGKGGSRPSFHVEVDHLDFTLPLTATAAFRKSTLGVEYDERGNAKEMTPAESAKLKGNSNLPGYAATLEEMIAGTPVKVRLQAPKSGASTSQDRPQIKMLVATGPPADSFTKGAAAPAKKKK